MTTTTCRLLSAIFVMSCVGNFVSAFELSSDDEALILKQVANALPLTLKIKRFASKTVPDDWDSFDKTALMIEAGSDLGKFKMWFLPKDWIGIRRAGAERQPVYWEGVLLGEKFKLIMDCQNEGTHESLSRALNMRTSSIVNGSWGECLKIFERRLDEVDQTTQRLIKEYCKDRHAMDAASHSLVVLGVPARSAFKECALNGHGTPQEFCVSAIGHFEGKDVVETLCKVLNDEKSAHECPKYAAMALARIRDSSSAEALMLALEKLEYIEAATQTARALANIRYKQAGPKILARMIREENLYYKVEFAKALADLKYEEAVPEIKKLCKTEKLTADWAWEMWQNSYLGNVPEVALLRLTGSWGTAKNGVRMLLLAPNSAILGKSLQIVVLIENVGDSSIQIPGYCNGTLIVDGDKKRRLLFGWNGHSNSNPGDVWIYPFDLSQFITEAGKHEIKYQANGVESNILKLDVLKADK